MIGPMKKKVITSVFLTAIIMIILFGVLGFVYISTTSKEMAELKEKKADAKAYVLTRDMLAGNAISSGDIQLVEVRKESAASDSFDEKTAIADLIGRRLKVSAKKNTIVTDSIFYSDEETLEKDTRLQEFNMVTLPSDLDEGDYIDIRIRFQTGEDYAVLTGKRVESFGATGAEGNTIFVRLSEEEIVRMGSAIIESYINKGVNLYANKYVDPAEQLFKSTIVDYVDRYEKAKYETISGEATVNELGETVYSGDTQRERTLQEIAVEIGLSVEETKEIRDALASNDTATLDDYKTRIVVSKDLITATYPVKPEVATLIQRDPNIMEDIQRKYDIAALEAERQALLDTDLTKFDPMTGEEGPYEEHINNLTEKIDKEIETQKTERQEYLLNLLSQVPASTTK